MRSVWLALALLIGLTAGACAQGCGAANPNCVVPTAPAGTSNSQAASTAFVHAGVFPNNCTYATAPFSQCIDISQNSPGGTTALPTNLNQIAIIESIDNTGGNFIDGLSIIHDVNGGAGGRQTLQISTTLTAAQIIGTNPFVVAFAPGVTSAINDGGTSGSTYGNFFAMNPSCTLTGTATYFSELSCQENDVAVATGASVKYLSGIKIEQLAAHANHAITAEGALVFTNATGAVGWNNLISVGAFGSGVQPLAAAGNIMAAISAITTTGNGIDFTNVTFSGGYAFKSPSYSVDGSGDVVSAGYLQGASFRVLGSSTGYTALASANAGASNYTATFPAATDTIAELTQTQTLTNKTIAFASNTLAGVAPLASPTFSGTVTGPDSGTWTSAGIEGSVIGAASPEAITGTTINASSGFSANGTAGVASKSCAFTTANVATGITLTIKEGLITGTTTC